MTPFKNASIRTATDWSASVRRTGRFDLLGRGDGRPEEGFQHRVGRARLPGEGEGGPDLGQNLVLSEDLGFHSARELEEMFRRLKALAADKAVPVRAGLRAPERAEQLIGFERSAPAQPQLGAVAGGEKNAPLCAKLPAGARRRLGRGRSGHREPLPYPDRGAGAVDPGHPYFQTDSSILRHAPYKTPSGSASLPNGVGLCGKQPFVMP